MNVSPPHQPESAATIRIGTFNVRWDDPNDGANCWDWRRGRLLDVLRAWEPDVLGLQEPRRFPLDQICQALPAYAMAGVGREDGQEAGEFCPIFFRRARFGLAGSGTFWFSDTPDTPGSRTWGNWHPRICTWVCLREQESGLVFYVYNLHWDNESQIARENSARLLLDRIHQRPTADPVIVMGDFNAEADNAAVARLRAADSPVPVSALRTAHPESSGTFHGFTGEAPGTPIDHIFLSPEWEVGEAQLLHGDGKHPFPSDHFPVAATLHRSGRKPPSPPIP